MTKHVCVPGKENIWGGDSWAEGADVPLTVRNSERTRLTLWFSSVNTSFSFWGCLRNGLSTKGEDVEEANR